MLIDEQDHGADEPSEFVLVEEERPEYLDRARAVLARFARE